MDTEITPEKLWNVCAEVMKSDPRPLDLRRVSKVTKIPVDKITTMLIEATSKGFHYIEFSIGTFPNIIKMV